MLPSAKPRQVNTCRCGLHCLRVRYVFVKTNIGGKFPREGVKRMWAFPSTQMLPSVKPRQVDTYGCGLRCLRVCLWSDLYRGKKLRVTGWNAYEISRARRCFDFTFIYPLNARVVEAPQVISHCVLDLVNSRLVHSLMLSSHFLFCLPCLLPLFTVPCKMVLARPDERETYPYHFSLRLFTMVKRSACGVIACWILA